jgi:glycerol-3-phosphate cytidylyltransferase
VSDRVYVGGSFDLFHTGHVNLLRRCADLGSVTVSLNSDAFIERFKGRPPVVSYADRAAVLRACRYVGSVVPNIGDEDSRPAIVAVAPSLIAVGDDWANRDYCAQMGFTLEWLAEHGIRLVFLPRTPGISSSDIRERIRPQLPPADPALIGTEYGPVA